MDPEGAPPIEKRLKETSDNQSLDEGRNEPMVKHSRQRGIITVRHPELCTGCLSCMLACSFHHCRMFSRSQSSIRIGKSLSEPGKGSRIVISLEHDQWAPVCDLCANEDHPLCIGFCPQNVFGLERRSS
ncbi:MAG: hypothetical protein JXL84_18600 [Deltaproteobacteria bacterium]|nr:hypothetical protein [Deltaproteobacteria bacterium]